MTLLGSAASADKAPFGHKVLSIAVEGNTRTKDYVITRELEFSKGDILTKANYQESLRRLRNLRIFTQVNFRFKVSKQKKTVKVIVRIEERWTTLPILKGGDAGGTQFITVGAFDINFLGRYWEIGAQYESLNGEPAGVTWFRNPRLFGQRLLFGYDLWFVNRNRELFDNDSTDPTRAFSLSKNRYHFFLKKELAWWLEPGLGIDYVQETVDQSLLDGEQQSKNSALGFNPSFESEQLFAELTLRLGRLNYNNYLVDGFQSDITFRTAQESLLSDSSETQITVQNRWFFELPHQQNVGLNFHLGSTDSRLLQNQFYVGGLSEVRGFTDGQFTGNNFWQANAEYRVPSYRSFLLVLQHVLFYDIGNTSNSLDRLFSNDETPFQSIGTGVRFISPKVFRFNLRIDVAKSFGRVGDESIALGLQQFF